MIRNKSQQLVTASQYLKKKGIDFKAPKKILISYSSKIDLSNFNLENQWKRGQLYLNGDQGILINLGIGSNILNISLEELHALGTKEFIILGFAGALNQKLKSGDIITSDKHKIYSTDDPYSEETKSWFNRMQKNKYDAVDMETKALMLKGAQLGIKTKSYLIIMDRLTLNGWDDSYNSEKVRGSYQKLFHKLTR